MADTRTLLIAFMRAETAVNATQRGKVRDCFRAFLARFSELIFQKYDELATETGQRRSVGLTQIDVVRRSERGGYVLNGRNMRWPL